MTTALPDMILMGFLRFAVRWDARTDEPIDWLRDSPRRKALGEAVVSVPLFRDRLKVGCLGDYKWKAITARTAPSILGGKREVIAEFQDREDDRTLFVGIDLDAGMVEVRIQVTTAALAGHEDTALDDLIAFTQRARKALAGVAGLEVGSVWIHDVGWWLEYPRARPPRRSLRYQEKSVVTFLDRRFHGSKHPSAKKDELATLLEPPPPAAISEKDGLVVVRSAKTLAREELVAAATAHNAWITARIECELADGYNELGDLRHLPDPDDEPMTLYKPVLVLPDGSIEESAWNAARKIAEAKALPDKTPVDGVWIVVPLREHVAVIAERARQAGFDGVVYPGDHGTFWDPDPPGPWLAAPPAPPPPAPTAAPRPRSARATSRRPSRAPSRGSASSRRRRRRARGSDRGAGGTA